MSKTLCMPRGICLLVLALGCTVTAADDYQPGQSYFGRKRYVEYLAGDLPVIISTPHGGREQPDEIPDRSEGTFAFDTNTQELARAVVDELHARTGHWPHLIACRIHRRKVDCNREIVEAAAGNPLAEQTWHEFQGYIDAAQQAVVRDHGRGLYIDLHGHGHAEQRLELGYLHTAEQLVLDDAVLNASPYPSDSSLRAIAALGRVSYAELIRGPRSFGALMEQHGFLCSPSPSNPHPKAPFFRGGYNTARHGRDAAPLAGLQIETNSRGVRDTAANRVKFAKALASTLETFLQMHIGVSLMPPRPVVVPAVAVSSPAAAPSHPQVESYPPYYRPRGIFRRGRVFHGR
jgi:N-formylglutamate amidohydrolase